MPAQVETMMYARAVPWHGIGTKVDGLQTAAEALSASGLDWTVKKTPAWFRHMGDDFQVPGKMITKRESDGAFLGVVGDNYQVVQNAEAFDWADSLVDSGQAKYETAGSLFGGRRVWLMMELPQGIRVPGDEGEIKPYLMVSNAHDGSGALRADVITERVVCHNTWTLAIKGATRTYKIRHSGTVEGKLAAARQALGVTFDYMDAFQVAAAHLAEKRVTDKQAERILEQVFPLPQRAKDNPERVDLEQFGRVLEVYRTAENLDSVRGTAWGVLQAVGEFLDHETEYRGRVFSPMDVRMDSIVYDGPAATKKQKAFALLSDRDFARAR